ncbi:hypothetical protein N008_14755 [Hymenobacter sp. APR13]|nr:hypothetical protein N008_14755 [Hymenobacter sp. APR13]
MTILNGIYPKYYWLLLCAIGVMECSGQNGRNTTDQNM